MITSNWALSISELGSDWLSIAVPVLALISGVVTLIPLRALRTKRLKARQVFVSFSQEDANEASKITEELQKQGFRTISADHGGGPHRNDIAESVKQSGAVIYLVPEHDNQWQGYELAALLKDARGLQRNVPPVLPVVTGPNRYEDLPSALRTNWVIDTSASDWRTQLHLYLESAFETGVSK